MKNKYFRLFSCCILVKGYARSVICDVQRGSYHFIPNDLYEILENEPITPIELIYKKYGSENIAALDEYFQLLFDEEYIFYCNEDEIDMFPPMNLKWDFPSVITNAILDFESKNDIKFSMFNEIIENLTDLGCVALQLRFFEHIDWGFIKEILCQNTDCSIESIEVIAKYDVVITYEELLDVKKKNQRISSFLLHSSPYFKTFDIPFKNTFFSTSTECISNSSHCEFINAEYFSTNISLFTEAQKHNTCLNRKISIDTEGYIRNCPSMKEHYGNIKDTTLQEALAHPDFKKYWFINKDQVAVCKDCEFRYICTDCRAYIENPEDMYSKPLKCGYNPYTCEWKEWSTNPLKQKAIDHYGMRELIGNW